VSISVSNAILHTNNTRTGVISVTFEAGIVRFGIRKNDVNRVRSRDWIWTNVMGL